MAFHAKATTTDWRALAAAGALLLAGVGCATKSKGETSVAELNRTIQSLRIQNAQYARHVEELENRVFILGDKAEAAATAPAAAAAPDLPKVVLSPHDRTQALSTNSAAESLGEAEPEVEFAGEAAKTTGKRPMLRLYGDETPVLLSTRERVDRERERDREEPRSLAVASEGSSPRPSTRAPAVAAPQVVASSQPAPVDLYRGAIESLRAGRHDEATAGFREFLRLHGSHELADNAQYWIAECYYDRKNYPVAVREFRRVLEKYPQGNKIPDAMLKVGFSQLALGSVDAGRQALEQLVKAHPRHEASVLAGAKLSELRSVGRPVATPPGPRPAQEVP